MMKRLLSLIGFTCASVLCYSSQNPNAKLKRSSLVGVWKLTSSTSTFDHTQTSERQTDQSTTPTQDDFENNSGSEYLIKLNDDGTFVSADPEGEDTASSSPTGGSLFGISSTRGTWEFRDHDCQLLLAADRPDDSDNLKVHDTLLAGEVLCSPDEKRTVPDGAIQIGKFMYPKRHPSFFEASPMVVNPTVLGTFSLTQVLSESNTQNDEEKLWVERFRREDFADKIFWLTSYPLPTRKPTESGELRWSIKYKKYVRDPPRPGKQQTPVPIDEEEEANDVNLVLPNIRVLKVLFFSNYTFSITDGIDKSSLSLRGMWDIFGEERDRLWMQITRFGFGRSNKGSTFSSGSALSHDDQKMYRGSIFRVNDKTGDKLDDKKEDGIVLLEEGPQDVVSSIHVKGEVYLGKVSTHREALFELREVKEDPDNSEGSDSLNPPTEGAFE